MDVGIIAIQVLTSGIYGRLEMLALMSYGIVATHQECASCSFGLNGCDRAARICVQCLV